MTLVQLELVDFMDAHPVQGARLSVSLIVFPMRTVFQQALLVPENDLGDPGTGGNVQEPDLSRAIELPVQNTISDANGLASFEFSTADAFREIRESGNILDEKIFARLNLDLSYAGFRRTLAQVNGDIEDGEVVSWKIVVDPAKCIVGHTSSSSANLWFALHADPLRGAEYHCEVSTIDNVEVQRFPAQFTSTNANTCVIEATNLQPDTAYTYRLLHHPGPPQAKVPEIQLLSIQASLITDHIMDLGAPERIVISGAFKTASTSRDNLDVTFSSCHLPSTTTSLNRWMHLGAADRPDVLLLMGDQIYEYDVETLGDSWLERYTNRYHQYWNPWAVRDVFRHISTYMIFDDHDVRDDWGTVPFDDINAGRETGALRAYNLFQKSHGPGGIDRPTQHYGFQRGPASFFMLDVRTQRVAPPPEALERENSWVDPPDSTILGESQLSDFREWANSPETQSSDVIFLVSPVPLAFLPVQEILRIVDDLEDEGRNAGTIIGGILGALAVGVGFIIGGPAGAVVGGFVGGALLGGGAIAGHSLANQKIKDEGLDNLADRDLADLWTWEPHQKDLVAVLDVLFGLANDIQPDGSAGSRPRAVFVLSGDIHTGTMHVIASDSALNPEHVRQPLLWQVTGTPISKSPADDKLFQRAIQHIVPGLDISAWKLIRSIDDIKAAVGGIFGEETANFPLDDRLGSRYHTEIVDVAKGRNYGRIRLERTQGRNYRFYVTIEGEVSTVVRAFELDLDSNPIRPKNLFGVVLAVEGRINLLRIQDLDHGYGPPSDRIDGEVVVALDSQPGRAFGFTLRVDENEVVHRGMLDVLRLGLANNALMRLIYIRTGLNNGKLIRTERIS